MTGPPGGAGECGPAALAGPVPLVLQGPGPCYTPPRITAPGTAGAASETGSRGLTGRPWRVARSHDRLNWASGQKRISARGPPAASGRAWASRAGDLSTSVGSLRAEDCL